MVGKYKFLKSLGAALVVEVILIYLLHLAGKILIDPAEVVENAVLFGIWWSFFTLIFYKADFILKNKPVLFRILGLLSMLVLAIIVDSYFQIPDNPLSIALFTVFWLGLVYMLMPGFFGKYAMVIGGIYLLILAYFTYARLFFDYASFTSERKETAILLFFLPIPFVILLWGYEQWQWVRSLQNARTRAELALLKSQISPHFFFNTLNNLYALTVNKSDKAPEVILKLSDMMRYTIYEGEKDSVPLADEIAYIQHYIELNEIRYRKNVKISFEKTVSGNPRIIPLIFIVPVENAFKHGVESLDDEAFIDILLESDGMETKFKIVNNFDIDSPVEEAGIGIENLKKRLELSYPDKHTLAIKKSSGIFEMNLTIRH